MLPLLPVLVLLLCCRRASLTCCKERRTHDLMEIVPQSGPTVGSCTLHVDISVASLPITAQDFGLYAPFTAIW
jgi:hypothetical protein